MSSDEVTTTPPAVAPGDRLDGRYEVLEQIGSGGMADVFHGWDESLCRDVAIKVIKLERISASMKKRVLREARASCAVDHPNMVRVTDIGYAGEAPFLVMDLLRGATLAEVRRQAPGGRLDWRHAISLLLPAMDALHLAHEAGLVHRDIKPENLFVHRRGASEVLMVLDLGIVKFTDGDGTPAPRWTQTGMILGTAMYMAPEQASSAPVDRRSDVYSMGVTLYRLLSGQHLFPCETGDNAITAMTRHIFEPPPRLSDPVFPSALVEAVHTSLAKDPAQRHASMETFASALRACLDDAAQVRPVWRAASAVQRVLHVGFGAALVLAVEQTMPNDAAAVAIVPTEATAPIAAVEPAGTVDELDLCVARDAEDVLESVEVPAAAQAEPERTPVNTKTRERRIGPAVVANPPIVKSMAPLKDASGAVRNCLRVHGDPDARALTVHVTLRADGTVLSAGIRGDGDTSFLATCVRDRLLQLRFEPGEPRSLEHTYAFVAKETP